MPRLRTHLQAFEAGALAQAMERAGLPYAPIRSPQELFEDPHLLATGGLAAMQLPDGPRAGHQVLAPLVPITLAGQRPGIVRSPPRCGEHSRQILRDAGWSGSEIDRLWAAGVVT